MRRLPDAMSASIRPEFGRGLSVVVVGLATAVAEVVEVLIEAAVAVAEEVSHEVGEATSMELVEAVAAEVTVEDVAEASETSRNINALFIEFVCQ